jgi:stage V sporulation protein D (sporulation-specific penicillin-binding protein)
VGNTTQEAKSKITKAGLVYKVIGDGENVVSQLPSSEDTLYAGGLVILYTDSQSDTPETTVVPDFNGMTVAQVNEAAINSGINVKFSGNTLTGANTLAYNQSIKAGETVDTGTSVTVYFRDSTVTDFAPDE